MNDYYTGIAHGLIAGALVVGGPAVWLALARNWRVSALEDQVRRLQAEIGKLVGVAQHLEGQLRHVYYGRPRDNRQVGAGE